METPTASSAASFLKVLRPAEPTPPTRYIKPDDLKRELTALVTADGGPDNARPHFIERVKEVIESARKQALSELEADGLGRRCAASLSMFQDDLICTLFDLVVTYRCTPKERKEVESMAIVATGGYGRGLLAPGSDIDLLFLMPGAAGAAETQATERLLYLLWDLGFKVGHATRSVPQCVQLALSDMTIATSMIDSRLIMGDDDLFHQLQMQFMHKVARANTRAFIDAKMAERDARHKRSGDARYRVEPNIKDGKGGLRDLHTLHWLSRAIYNEDVGEAAIRAGIFTEEEVTTFHRCEDFLWSVRCFLHFLTGRAEERLTFDVQSQMAELLGYKRHGGLRAVERFMKHYFLVAKDVGDLTGILCGALEIQQLKSTPTLGSMLKPLTWRTRRQVRTRTDFRIDSDRLNVADPEVFKRDPVNILRLFDQSARTGTFLHPNAVRLLRRSSRLIDKKMRENKEANRLFVTLISDPDTGATTLRRMNDAGILGRFVPPFRRVVGMMQFNMYHHYTVDEHLIRTVERLSEIERGEEIEELPLSTGIFKTLSEQNRRLLYVTAFLHDIGKGRREDHSVVGARIAAELAPRFGLSKRDSDTVVWLIAEHLTMSNISQRRDLSDPRTIRDFAELVGSLDRLKLLLLLTVADIRAVGPDTWNGWKGQLLRTLYYETKLLLTGSQTEQFRSERVAEAQQALATELRQTGWSQPDIEMAIGRFFDDYWLRFETDVHLEHALFMQRAEKDGEPLAVVHKTDAFTAVTELTILAPNHPRLLSLFAGACSSVGADIVGAHITSTRDGLALDTFLLQREFDDDEDEARRATRIREAIERYLKGEARVQKVLAGRRTEQRVEAFDVSPRTRIDNDLSDEYTVIEVTGRDRSGLLYELTSELSDLSLDISSAHISTFGEKVIDAFYVTDLTHKKITDPRRQADIAQKLGAIVDVEEAHETDETG
ncbi:MAG: [protein-PII] uridylyltransferase [Alphaproteobacteria bacterium]|nr:[protein-PII] uridylyltransferase [Alphaproteobacteria bacterium]